MARTKPFDSEPYERKKAAEKEVARRIVEALDRLGVAMEFQPKTAAIVAQTIHAIHHIEKGYANDSRSRPVEAPDFIFHSAEELTVLLAQMLAEAWRAGIYNPAEDQS